MKEEIKQKIQKIADTHGYDAQSRQCIEEMSELTQAINKFWRRHLSCGAVTMEDVKRANEDLVNMPLLKACRGYENLVEEIADVQIMLWQMEYLLDADIEPIVNCKLDRQLKRIAENERSYGQ